jgi:hypothetical protein
MVHGSWFMVHGSWFMVHGSWFMVHGSWFLVHGSWFMVLGSKWWSRVATKNQERAVSVFWENCWSREAVFVAKYSVA